MSFKQQLRECLGGVWGDFWNVAPRRVLVIAPVIVWAVGELVWKTAGALSPSVNLSYHAYFPARFVCWLGLLVLLNRNPR